MKIRFDVCNSSDENEIPTNQTNLIVRASPVQRGWFLFAYSALHNNKTFNNQPTSIFSWNDKKQHLKLLNKRFFKKYNYSFRESYHI